MTEPRASSDPLDDYVTIKEAVARWPGKVKAGMLRYSDLPRCRRGKAHLYRISDIKAMLEAGFTQAVSQPSGYPDEHNA